MHQKVLLDTITSSEKTRWSGTLYEWISCGGDAFLNQKI